MSSLFLFSLSRTSHLLLHRRKQPSPLFPSPASICNFICIHLRFRPSVFSSVILFAILFSSVITRPLLDRRHSTVGDQCAKAQPTATRDPSHVAHGFALQYRRSPKPRGIADLHRHSLITRATIASLHPMPRSHCCA
jgi:hypothetical protein